MADTPVCDAVYCRYCSAAADYLSVPSGAPQACWAARQADRAAEIAAFACLRELRAFREEAGRKEDNKTHCRNRFHRRG